MGGVSRLLSNAQVMLSVVGRMKNMKGGGGGGVLMLTIWTMSPTSLPANLPSVFQGERSKKAAADEVAIALASIFFPVPSGPYNKSVLDASGPAL